MDLVSSPSRAGRSFRPLLPVSIGAARHLVGAVRPTLASRQPSTAEETVMKTSSISTLAAAGGLLAALAGGAPAEAALASKTLYASGVTAPGGMVFIKDSTAAGGHVWYSDHVNGVCRLDPAGTGATATANPSTCLVFGAATQIAYDPLGKWLYMVDISKRALGVRKIAVNTTTGTLNKLKQSTLVPPVAGMRLTAAAVDPKGNLYIGERQGGGIYKYAATSNTAGAAGAATQVGSTED